MSGLLSHAQLSSNILQIVPVMDGIHSGTRYAQEKDFLKSTPLTALIGIFNSFPFLKQHLTGSVIPYPA